MSLGVILRDLRSARGWSQAQLAAELTARTQHHVTQTQVSRWETGKRTPGPFWTRHLASALAVPLSVLQDHRDGETDVHRRTVLLGAAALLASPAGAPARDITSSIASGDPGPLASVQTSHATDRAISKLTGLDRGSLLHLTRWADDGDSDVLRVNAAGILAKTGDPVHGDTVGAVLARDEGARQLYLTAVTHRVTGISWMTARHWNPAQATDEDLAALRRELSNPADAGARWCSAVLLAQAPPSPETVVALSTALRREPSRETLRAIGLALTGETPHARD